MHRIIRRIRRHGRVLDISYRCVFFFLVLIYRKMFIGVSKKAQNISILPSKTIVSRDFKVFVELNISVSQFSPLSYHTYHTYNGISRYNGFAWRYRTDRFRLQIKNIFTFLR
jgi:hypothetical protein